MPIKNAKTIQIEPELYDNIKKLADEVRDQFNLPDVSQHAMVKMMYHDYVSHRKNKAKRERRNG